MKNDEKTLFLKENYFSLWLQTRQIVNDELSAEQEVFCICGKLATGLHESRCKKFQNQIDSEVVKRLNHLIVNKDKLK